MEVYRVTTTVCGTESEREQLRRKAARAVYAELVKYIKKVEGKTA